MSEPNDLQRVIHRLDAIGFDVANYHVSVYRGLLIIIVVVLVLIAGRIASAGVRRIFRRIPRLDPAQQVLGEKLTGIVVWVLLASWALDVLGISLTALTVFSGAIGLAIGFGLQKTFGNLVSGLILLMDRSIKPGDVIAVGDERSRTVGQVKRIGIRAVSVTTRDKVEYLIPNEQLMVSTVENWSYSSRDVRVKVPVSVAYSSDIDLVERVLLEEARKLKRMLPYHDPSVWLSSFGENAIEFEVQLWIDDPEDGLGNLRSDYLKAVWHAFRVNNIEIPFAQRDVRVKEWPAPRE